MASVTMNSIYLSNRAYDVTYELSEDLVGTTIKCPDNISILSWTIIIPDGVKAKLQASTFPQDTLTDAETNLDKYWLDWDLEDTQTQDDDGYVTGPVTIQGAIPVVSGIRVCRESVGDAVELGLRGQ